MPQSSSVYVNGARQPYAREAVGTLTSSKGLTSGTFNVGSGVGTTYNSYDRVTRPEEAMVQVKTAAINWTVDTSTPTTTATTDVGFVAQVGDFIILQGYQTISQFRCINSVASSGASLEVVYFK